MIKVTPTVKDSPVIIYKHKDQLSFLKKRKHVVKYKDEVPPKELIESILRKSWEVTPSKQNFMPYTITILGPNETMQKIDIGQLTSANQKRVTEENTPGYEESGKNIFFDNIVHNPYLLLFTPRVCKPNAWVQKQIDERNQFYEQTTEERGGKINTIATLEVGLFISNLTNFCLEEGLTVSHCGCFPSKKEEWSHIKKDGMPIVDRDVFAMISIGYPDITREDVLIKMNELHLDTKPDLEDILKWI